MAGSTVFVVEQAGCVSCAALVRDALEKLGPVAEVTVNEHDDTALVRLGRGVASSADEVDRLLAEASVGTGHTYRVAPGSWRDERPSR